MVELQNRRILIDEKPTLIFSGEIHYFRLLKKDWEDRIVKLKKLGCNSVASYVPWIFHEPREGEFDVTGRFRPESDLGAFIDLCHRHGLWFIPRPGPFIMAEMKNEGIPHWFYKKHPEAIPVSWRGEKAHTATLDYLNEGFLDAAKKWYGAVMPLFASRLQPSGGPIIGVQLDNEIGMLSWVTNQPDLSEDTQCDFSKWLITRYDHEHVAARYPFDFNDPMSRSKGLLTPKPEYGPALLRDYGDYERDRFARYIKTLRGFAEANGIHGVPFIVNIHGSGGGRGTQFPIGISQLYETYTQDAGYLAGSDHYLGELTRDNAPDLYFINAFMAAVNRPEQPLASMEFEVGSGDYGETGGVRMSGSAADFKIRLSQAQGNRLLNYYLLSGGHNPHLLDPVGDGNDRIAFTGERHGFAAPISPDGKLDPTYDSLKATTWALRAVSDKLASMDEEHDGVALAFVPDYYKTNFRIPGLQEKILSGIESAREPLALLTRAMLLNGYRFPALDIQNRAIDPKTTPMLAFAASRYLDEQIQRKLVGYLRKGGNLFIYGEFPCFDMEGRDCLVLANALGLKPIGFAESTDQYRIAYKGQGWLEDEPEVSVWRAQLFAEPSSGVIMRVVDTQTPTAFAVEFAAGKAVVFTGNYSLHMGMFRRIFEKLGARAALQHDYPFDGILTVSQINAHGERFLTVLNLDCEDKAFSLAEHGHPLFEGHRLSLAGKKSKLLPIGVLFGPIQIRYSTTGVLYRDAHSVTFEATGRPEWVCLESAASLHFEGATVERTEHVYRIRSSSENHPIKVDWLTR